MDELIVAAVVFYRVPEEQETAAAKGLHQFNLPEVLQKKPLLPGKAEGANGKRGGSYVAEPVLARSGSNKVMQ